MNFCFLVDGIRRIYVRGVVGGAQRIWETKTGKMMKTGKRKKRVFGVGQ